MKKITCLFVFLSAFNSLWAQNVGIGTTTPLIKLHVKGGLLLDSTNGVTPVSGPGTRLMWIPGKKAFRAGEVTDKNWDNDSIGINSIAFGFDSKAFGLNSTAMGYETEARGSYSTAMGLVSNAIGYVSTAIGGFATASGDYALSAGFGTKSKWYGGIVVGTYNDSTNAGVQSLVPNNRIFQIGNGTSDFVRRNAVTVLQNGSVGIGTVTPIAPLHVRGTFGHVASFDGGSNMHVLLEEGNIVRGYMGSYAGNAEDVDFGTFFGNSTGKVHLTTRNSPRLTISTTGNIGIGQINPVVPLNFADETGNKISLWGNGASSNYGLGIQASLLQMYSNSSTSDIAFGYGSSTSFTERMRIKGNGKVGIGIINPGEIFEVADRILLHSGGSGSAGIWLNKLDNTAAAGFVGTYDNNHIGMYGLNFLGWPILMNTTTGNVGIGVANPSQKLQVNGNICYTGSIAACSDIRYKKNIQSLNNSLNKILSLHGISYNWNKEKFKDKAFVDEAQIGFSAQEIERLFPELVQTDAAGYKAVDYGRLTPVLVEAVKEQQQQIDAQNKKIEWLMNEMQALKEKIK